MHEKLFFDNRTALDPGSQHSHLEKLLDSFQAHRAVVTEESVPPALVLERGSFTLHVSLPIPNPATNLEVSPVHWTYEHHKGVSCFVNHVEASGQLSGPQGFRDRGVSPSCSCA